MINARFKVEAVLCEDQQTVMFYRYQGEELIGTCTQSLPLLVNEDTFEAIRPEWEQAWVTSDA